MDLQVTTKRTRKGNVQDVISTNDDKAWITISRNINLGNYESYKIEAGFNRTIQIGENPIDLLIEMETELSQFINKKARILKKKSKTN